LDRHPEVKLVLPTIMVSAFTPTPLFGSKPTLLHPQPVTLFAVQGGMLMPIKVGGKLRSPRGHAAAATQEICDCWEVEWPSIRLLVLPLADGTTSLDGFEF
jgi:hypothetical protein